MACEGERLMALVVITDPQELAQAISSLRNQLREGCELVRRTVTFPGTHGPIKDAEVIWRKHEGFWALLQDLPTRYWCAYGITLGPRSGELNIDVEINPPHQGINRSVYGQIVADEAAQCYLAHKGGLGGGRGGTVTIEDFWRSFQNPERQFVTWKEDSRQAKMHIVRKIGSPQLLQKLSYFIREAHRIRRLAKSGQLRRA